MAVWEDRQPKIQSFFGPGIIARVSQVRGGGASVGTGHAPGDAALALWRHAVCGRASASVGACSMPAHERPHTHARMRTQVEEKRVEVALISDGSGAGRSGKEIKEALPPLMPGLKARQQQ